MSYETLKEKHPNTMSLTITAGILGTTVKRLEFAVTRNKDEFPYVVDLSMPGDDKPHYKVITDRFITYMMAGDMESAVNEKLAKEIATNIFKQLAGVAI